MATTQGTLYIVTQTASYTQSEWPTALLITLSIGKIFPYCLADHFSM
jgi:hypothetical protein